MTNPPADQGPEAVAWERALRELGTASRAAGEKAYLKSDLEFAGTAVPAIRALVTAWCKARPGLAHDGLTGLVEKLWESPLYECRQAAVILLERSGKLLGPADLPLLEHLLRTSRTWALVDGLAVNVVGGLAEGFPQTGAVLDRWPATRTSGCGDRRCSRCSGRSGRAAATSSGSPATRTRC